MGESEEPRVSEPTGAGDSPAENAAAPESATFAEEPLANDDIAAVQQQLEVAADEDPAHGVMDQEAAGGQEWALDDSGAPGQESDAIADTVEAEAGGLVAGDATEPLAEGAAEPLAEGAATETAVGDTAEAVTEAEGEAPGGESPEAAVETTDEVTDAELEAAIAASEEQVTEGATLDDIAPGTVHDATAEELVVEPIARYGAPWWPFLVYLGLWVVLAGIAVWQIQQLPIGTVVYETEAYAVLVAAGLVMAAAGPVLMLAVWLGARFASSRHRAGLLTSALLKGGIATFVGVLLWWGTLMGLDYIRLGRPF